MTTAVDVSTVPHRSRLSLTGVLRHLLRVPSTSHRLAVANDPITDLRLDAPLSLRLADTEGSTYAPAVKPGDEVRAGQPIATPATHGGTPYASPVAGKITAVAQVPDIRGGRPALAVQIEPAADSSPIGFAPLNANKVTVAELRQRVRDAGIRTNDLVPRPLTDLLAPATGPRTLVVLAADREPRVSATVQLLRERTAQAVDAAVLLGRMVSATITRVAVLAPLHGEIVESCKARGVAPLLLDPFYPATLEPLVTCAARAAGDPGALVIPLETALAAADAIGTGKVQASKVVSIRGPKGRLGNYRVPIGTRLGDVFAALKLQARPRDKVVVGGPLRGFAQHSLEGAVDCGVDGLALVRARDVVPWSDAPCINCGTCIDVCPAHLQVQLIGRYAEFGLFETTRGLGIDACFECGLCAAACTARRPLLQLIRLAKRELTNDRTLEAAAG